MDYSTSSNKFEVPSHNGPVCMICHKPYVGYHTCTREDIARRIAELERYMQSLPVTPQSGPQPWTNVQKFDPATCPCHPSNGGSGICGCIMSGPIIT